MLFVDCLWVENLSGCAVGNRRKKQTNKHRGDSSNLCNPYPTACDCPGLHKVAFTHCFFFTGRCELFRGLENINAGSQAIPHTFRRATHQALKPS